MLTQEIVDTDRVTSQTGMPKRLPKRPPDYLSQLLPSWQLSLRSERKSESTVKVYTDGVQGFLKWCDSTNTPASLTKQTVQQFTAHLLSEGAEPATARSRQLALKRYSAWLAEEGEIDALVSMGLPLEHVVVLPRVLGSVVSFAGMVVSSAAAGLVGGFLLAKLLSSVRKKMLTVGLPAVLDDLDDDGSTNSTNRTLQT